MFGEKLKENSLEGFTINDMARADTLDELDNVGRRVVDRKVESDFVGHINDELKAANVVDKNGKPLKFETAEEVFTFFEEQVDQLYKLGVLEETKEATNMLAYMKSLVTGRDPKNASRSVSAFIRVFQKAATAMSSAGFAFSTIPELLSIGFRSLATKFFSKVKVGKIKDYAKDVKKAKKRVDEIRQELQAAIDKGDEAQIDYHRKRYEEAQEEFIEVETKQQFLTEMMYSAGVGTEGALFRNTGSNRKSVIFDSENPMFNPATQELPIGQRGLLTKGGDFVQEQLSRMATDAADGELIPVAPTQRIADYFKTRSPELVNNAVGAVRSAAKKFSVNAITEWNQKVVFRTMTGKFMAIVDGLLIPDIDWNNAAQIRELASEVMDPALYSQLGLNDKDVVRLAIQIQEILKSNPDLKTVRKGITMFDIGSIFNHSSFDPQLREKFQASMYNWIGHNVVKPDAGDLPMYVSNSFINLLLQFRSFGMAQFQKTIAPALQRVRRGGVSTKAQATAGALGTTVLMNALWNMFNYYINNQEEVDEDMERMGGLDNYLKSSLPGYSGYVKPKTNMGKQGFAGLMEPFIGPVSPTLDVAMPIAGIEDPLAWYEQDAYGGKYSMAEDILRTSAAFRAGANIIDPVRRFTSGKGFSNRYQNEAEYSADYAAKLSGRNKTYNMFKAMYGMMSD